MAAVDHFLSYFTLLNAQQNSALYCLFLSVYMRFSLIMSSSLNHHSNLSLFKASGHD